MRLAYQRARIGQGDLQVLTCDVCLEPLGPKDARWSCAACDWDVCPACRGAGSELSPTQEIASDVAALARKARQRSRARARALAEAEHEAADRTRRDAREEARRARADAAEDMIGRGGRREGSTARKRGRVDGEDGRPPRVKMTRAAAGSRENV